jgi:putative ABC transport system permease protein
MKYLDYLRRILRVALFIATKSIQRGSITVKLVTVFILVLTLLNLTVIGGLLNGITEDVGDNMRKSFVGDIFIEPLSGYEYIQNERDLLPYFRENAVAGYSARLLKGVTLEYDYKNVSGNKKPPHVGTTLVGIDPDAEAATTTLPEKVIAGRFLESTDRDAIVLGSALVDGYVTSTAGTADTLGHVLIGDQVRARFSDGATFEYTVVGITNTKAASVDQRSFVNYKRLAQISGFPDTRYSEIAIRTIDRISASSLVTYLRDADAQMGYKNDIKEAKEAMPQAINDLQKAFALISTIVGATAILVGLVTVFVIIFINASSRRRHLGILKAQGIEPSSLILSYVFQILFYTIIGIVIGTAILFFVLQGYFEQHPISLPMADGKLLLGFDYIALRITILMVSSLISGFIPAWFIIRQNTLDSILGR